MQFIRQGTTGTDVIFVDDELISRRVGLLRGQACFFQDSLAFAREEPQFFQGIRHVMRIQAKPFPPAGVHRNMESYSASLANFSLLDDFLHVTLYELQGPVAHLLGMAWDGI